MSSDEEPYSESEAGSDDDGDDEEWTNDHLKLLYLVSKYAKCSLTAEEKEGWIRKNSLLVLIYEGIVEGVFDYDYAPQSGMVGTKRVWLNISQEGKDDIDDIREGTLINGLKLASADLQPITAYQVSPKGLDILDLVPEELKEQVDSYVYGKEGYEEDLLVVEWNEESEGDDGDVEPGFEVRCAAAVDLESVLSIESRSVGC